MLDKERRQVSETSNPAAVLDSLSKECFDSFWLFLSLRRNGESVCAVTVSWPLRHACQIQMVSAVPLGLSWSNKHIHKKRKSPVVTTANYVTHNTMVSQASNKLKIMGRKKKQGSRSVKEQCSKNVMNNMKFQRNISQKWQRLPWTTGNSIMRQDCRWLLVWAEEQLDWVYFRSGTMEWSHMQVNTMEVITSLLLNGTRSSLNVW